MSPHTREEIRDSEEARLNVIKETLGGWTSLSEKMNDHYVSIIAKYQKERREILKYLATIAGGGAALAPQLLDHVQQPHFFYTGIGLLCTVVVIAVTYILTSIENDVTKLVADLRDKNIRIDDITKPKNDFLKKGDYSLGAFSKAMTDGKDNLSKEDKKSEIKNGWYQPMDYTGEFIVLFTVSGLALLALGLTSHSVSWAKIALVAVSVFIVINIISVFPTKVFVWLGFPIDLVKSAFRWFKKRKCFNL
jgi:hypothetical protein